jgi:hypothetical protein
MIFLPKYTTTSTPRSTQTNEPESQLLASLALPSNLDTLIIVCSRSATPEVFAYPRSTTDLLLISAFWLHAMRTNGIFAFGFDFLAFRYGETDIWPDEESKHDLKENALGRLLQEIVGRSGDIIALDWVGISSEFNSCLPADITSYEAPPCVLPLLSEDDIQTSVSSLRRACHSRGTEAVELALRIYTTLDNLSAPRFSHRRLHLPCIAFPIKEVRRRHGQDQETPMYEVKTDRLGDLLITTEDRLIPFPPTRPLSLWQTLLLVRPWNRSLLELPNTSDDTQSMQNLVAPSFAAFDPLSISLGKNEPVDTDSHSRALQLIVRLGQPFSAFLLARQHSGEYKRIASNHYIVAQVKDMSSVRDMMDIRTLKIS